MMVKRVYAFAGSSRGSERSMPLYLCEAETKTTSETKTETEAEKERERER
jgi:hypothetical protein